MALMRSPFKIAWHACMFAVLAWLTVDYLDAESQQMQFELGLKYLIVLSLLSFPLGPLLLLGVTRGLDVHLSGVNEGLMLWAVCFTGGYIQWFVLLPRVFRKRHSSFRASE